MQGSSGEIWLGVHQQNGVFKYDLEPDLNVTMWYPALSGPLKAQAVLTAKANLLNVNADHEADGYAIAALANSMFM